MDLQNYKKRVEDMVENSFIVMSMGIGCKVGLFEAFRDIPQPCTSTALANKANLKERYVREWLAGMVAGKIVTVNGKNEYSLPVEAEWIMNLKVNPEILTILGSKSTALIECMRKDGPSGFTYDRHPDALEYIAKDRKSLFSDKWIDDKIGPITKMLKGDNLSILDFGCGYGILTIALAKHYPSYSITAIDELKDVIDKCKKENPCPNISYYNIAGEDMKEEWTSKYDLVIMFDVLHDLADPVKALEVVKRVLKPDGFFIAFDPPLHSDPSKNVDLGLARMYLTISLYVCLPCSLSRQPCIGHGIGWGYEKRKQFLTENGFALVPVGDEDLDKLSMRLVCKKLQ